MKGKQLGSDSPSTFQTDLEEAHILEIKLGKEWCSNYNASYTTTQADGSNPAYDVAVTFHDHNKTITFEVKQDKMAAITNNIAVEFQRTWQNGTVRPTCISISEADIYAYYFDGQFNLIETDSLRKLIQDKLYSRIVNGAGDGDRASCYLFSKDVFKKHTTVLNKYFN